MQLQRNAKLGAKRAREIGHTGRIIGVSKRRNPDSDHPKGLAIDLMGTRGIKAHGLEFMKLVKFADHFRLNHKDLKVKRVIFYASYADESTDWKWVDYTNPYLKTNPLFPETRVFKTLQHYDHVHISFLE